MPKETYDTTWARLHDPDEPMWLLGADVDGKMLGIVHYIYHRSCWTVGDYCYLQDLFVAESARKLGLGRALIEAVYREAQAAGASRVYWLTHETNATARALYDKLATGRASSSVPQAVLTLNETKDDAVGTVLRNLTRWVCNAVSTPRCGGDAGRTACKRVRCDSSHRRSRRNSTVRLRQTAERRSHIHDRSHVHSRHGKSAAETTAATATARERRGRSDGSANDRRECKKDNHDLPQHVLTSGSGSSKDLTPLP